MTFTLESLIIHIEIMDRLNITLIDELLQESLDKEDFFHASSKEAIILACIAFEHFYYRWEWVVLCGSRIFLIEQFRNLDNLRAIHIFWHSLPACRLPPPDSRISPIS